METLARGRIEGLLLSASWVERLRCELGLKGIHQVWGEAPAWYFWLAGSPGAHGLDLAQVQRLGMGRKNLLRADFLVRFFPRPNRGDVRNIFSPGAGIAAKAPFFDRSGTPDFDRRGDIPSHLFSVGALDLIWDPDQTWALYTIDRPGPLPPGAPTVTGPGARAPCWKAGRRAGSSPSPFTSGSWALHAFQHKHTPPCGPSFSSEAGFEQVRPVGREQALTHDCPPTTGSTPWRFFWGRTRPGPRRRPWPCWNRKAAPNRAGKPPVARFLVANFHPWEAAVDGEPVLHPDWWRLAGVGYKSHLASACGCEH